MCPGEEARVVQRSSMWVVVLSVSWKFNGRQQTQDRV